jgi:GNAT superfamily N-acetyltransferase
MGLSYGTIRRKTSHKYSRFALRPFCCRAPADLHEMVSQGPPPGLLAFDGRVAVGWCQLTPRTLLPWLDRAWQRIDDLPVWSISCLYIRKGHRRQGITLALVDAAIKTAKEAGAPALEAYPLDGDLSPSASGTGICRRFSEPASGSWAAVHERVRSFASTSDHDSRRSATGRCQSMDLNRRRSLRCGTRIGLWQLAHNRRITRRISLDAAEGSSRGINRGARD